RQAARLEGGRLHAGPAGPAAPGDAAPAPHDDGGPPAWFDEGHAAPGMPAGRFDGRARSGGGGGAGIGSFGRNGWRAARGREWADAAPYAPPRSRQKPITREDHALRLMLTDPAAWDRLAPLERQMLMDLPTPHGAFFAWLEEQWHEHGPQPWAALQQAIEGQAFAALALQLMANLPAVDETPPEEIRRELQGVLLRIRDEQLKRQESEALQAVGSDPQALGRYRALNAERKSLQQRLKSY
ncbi:MAG: DNA primase, partial [Comamonas sp.]